MVNNLNSQDPSLFITCNRQFGMIVDYIFYKNGFCAVSFTKGVVAIYQIKSSSRVDMVFSKQIFNGKILAMAL